MSIETSANPVGPQEERTVPLLRTFQTLDVSSGHVAENVNLFRGNVTFPLTLLSLANRGGLQTDVVLNYQSDVGYDVMTWNLESPTSIVGLGWEMPYAMIELDFRNTISPYDDAYYLSSSDGSRSRLYQTAQTADLWTFEAEDFDFSTIQYFPKRQLWHITDTSGNTQIFGADLSAGGDASFLRHAIKWGGVDGNWTDSSVQPGQALFPISWNLATVRNPWGDEINFTYSRFPDDVIQIGGPTGLYSTRASYLETITDPSGRVVRFQYGDKLYTNTIREYQPPHAAPPPPQYFAYQDRYETRYLDSVKVSQTVSNAPVELFTIRFDYSVENLAPAGTPGDARYLYKRYLRGLTTVNAGGKLLPGMRFDYYTGTETDVTAPIHQGAIKAVTYPQGGVARYTYQAQSIPTTALDFTMSRTDPDWVAGIPRFWFGPDYLVITYYDEVDSNKLTVCIHDWNGQWLTATPVATHLPFSLDMSSLQLVLQEDFLTLSYQLEGGGTNGVVQTWAIRRAYGRFGVWDAVSLAMPALASSTATWQVDAGTGFIVAAATGVSTVYRYTWDPRAKQWRDDSFSIAITNEGSWTLGAYDDFFALCQFQPGMPLALTLHYYETATLVWHDDLPALDTIQTYVWQDDLPKLSWSLSDSFATATYLSAASEPNNTIDYEVRVYQWDAHFAALPSPPPIRGTAPADTKVPVYLSLAAGSLVGNVGNLLRYDGVQWNVGTLGTFEEGQEVAHFTYGGDIAIGVNDAKGVIAVYSPSLGQFNTTVQQTGSWGPARPTINSPYLTVRNSIYQQQSTGELTLLNQQLPVDAVVVSNQAPVYMAYGLANGASFLWLMKNGVMNPTPISAPGTIFPPNATAAGTELAGPFAFATYTGVSLDQPDTISLHRVLFGRFTGPAMAYVVTSVVVTDSLGTLSSASFDYATSGATATVNPFGLAVQFGVVKSVLGSTTPATAPFGYSINHYFDGMIPDYETTTLLYTLTNGLLKEVVGYTNDAPIARTERVWETVQQITGAQTGAAIQLIGAYVRMSQSIEHMYDVDPMSLPAQQELDVPTTLQYNEANGQPRAKLTRYFDNVSGQYLSVSEGYVYAYEKYPALAAPELNMLAPSVQVTETSGGLVTRIEATTWTQVTQSTTTAWAPYRRYRARAGTATLTAANWDNSQPADPTQWKSEWQVTRRDKHGEVAEYIAADGLSNTLVSDRSQGLVTAAFGNASGLAGQALYLGFEIYEELDGWTLAGSASAFAAAIVAGNANVGSRSLQLAGSTIPNSSPATRSLQVTETTGRSYVLSCFVKTPAGFSTDPGTAEWTVTGAAGGPVTLAIPDTDGQWTYLFLPFDLAADALPQNVTLSLTNTKTAAMLIDDIRLSPARSGFTGSVYDPALLQQVASIESTGATKRSLLGDFGETQADVDALEAATKVASDYLSRRGNLGQFSASDPNASVTLQPRSFGFYQSFDLGDVFAGSWTSTSASAWQTAGGSLRHVAGTNDAIAYTGFPEAPTDGRNVFGASLRARPQGALTAPLGMSVGDAYTIGWNPGTGAWSVADTNGATLYTAAVRASLQVSFATYVTLLDASMLPPDFPALFSGNGLPLAIGSTVQAVSATAWRVLDSASQAVYYLARSTTDASQIVVTTAPREWTLLVVGQTLSLFADGGRAFSYGLPAPVSRAFGLFAADAVWFDNAIFYTDPQIQISFADGGGSVRQEQVADPSASNDNRMVARAHLMDALARPVIDTQFAALAPASSEWGTYQDGLAALDWTTLAMTGIVATQNPESGVYPYWRTRHEASPLGRKAEVGLPGTAYAITPVAANNHTTRYQYGLNDSALGYTAGKFTRITTINPNGVTRCTLSDERGCEVASATRASAGAQPVWNTTSNQFDVAGNLVVATTPMGWSDTFAYDFLGLATSASRANEGTTRTMYDALGRLRFQMTARGALSPSYIRYWKYDALSRVADEGLSLQSWPGDLAQHVDDQSFPVAQASNVYDYDFAVPATDPISPLALGRLTRSTSGNEVSSPSSTDAFRVIETFEYDIWATTVVHTLAVDGDGETYTTEYGYNNLGEMLTIQYPGSDGAGVAYVYDLVGRIAAISVNENVVAAYTFNHNGLAETETLSDDEGNQVGAVRTFTYAPPAWLTSTTGSNFTETTVYAPAVATSGSVHDGSPSKVTTDARAGVGPITTTYGYDPLGRLASQTTELAATELFVYDANGNMTTVGVCTNTYTTATQDRVQSTITPSDTIALSYDASGETTANTPAAAPSEDLSIEWDGFRDLPLLLTRGRAPTQTSWNVRYGYKGDRVRRVRTDAAGVQSSTLYLRGAGDDPLVEIATGAAVRQYVRGPMGMVQFRDGTTPYFVAKDRLGSIRAVMDASAELIGGYDYLPYGESRGAVFGSNPEILIYRFTDRELEETGLYDFRGRLYDPRQGRFISADPAHQFLSPYIYAGNNPLLLVDPTGQFAFLAAIFAIIDVIAEVVVAIELTTIAGAAVGALAGVVQGAEVIASNDLSGGEAAGAFFGTLVLNTVGGALSGGAGAVTGAFVEGVTLASAAAITVGVGVQAGIAAAQASAQAALVGDDPGEAAWQNAVAAGTAFLGGALSSAGIGKLLTPASWTGTTKAVIRGVGSGVIGGGLSSATNVAINRESGDLALSDVLQGMALGIVGGVFPEVIDYKTAKFNARIAAAQKRIGAAQDQSLWTDEGL